MRPFDSSTIVVSMMSAILLFDVDERVPQICPRAWSIDIRADMIALDGR